MRKFLSVGTRSVFYGAHCFLLHPWFVAWGWCKLFGFTWDPRIWVAFLVHDIGYIGKPNLDGPEGETHVELGAKIMHALFDWEVEIDWELWWHPYTFKKTWHDFCLYHSRHYAKQHNRPVSKLAAADKLAFCLTPARLYLPMVKATGELKEYMDQIQWRGSRVGGFESNEIRDLSFDDPMIWHRAVVSHTSRFVEEYMKDYREGM